MIHNGAMYFRPLMKFFFFGMSISCVLYLLTIVMILFGGFSRTQLSLTADDYEELSSAGIQMKYFKRDEEENSGVGADTIGYFQIPSSESDKGSSSLGGDSKKKELNKLEISIPKVSPSVKNINTAMIRPTEENDDDGELEKEDHEVHHRAPSAKQTFSQSSTSGKPKTLSSSSLQNVVRTRVASTKPKPAYTKPEKDTIQKKRFPQAVIIGFPKCGTRALLTYLSMHPYIVTCYSELHFYDRNFDKGYSWYLEQMPLSWSNQVTMEKTPAYSRTPLARTEMKKKFPNIKLLVLVRDPIVRLLSQEAQLASYAPEQHAKVTKAFLDEKGTGVNNKTYEVSQSMFYTVIEPWFRTFPKQNILVINGDELTANPLPILKRIEVFLNVPRMFSEKNFILNKETGFYCTKGFEPNSEVTCLARDSKKVHKTLTKKHEEMLHKFFKPLNEKFYKLINQTFDWD